MAEQNRFETPSVDSADGLQRAALALVSQYQVTVYGLALNLTGQAEAATEVTEEVFVQLLAALERHVVESEEQLEALVHQTTYDVALSRLMNSIAEHHRSVLELDAERRNTAANPTAIERPYDEASITESSLNQARQGLLRSGESLSQIPKLTH